MTLPPGAREVPALPGHWLFGSLAELQDDYLGTLLRASRELGPVVRIHAGPPGWRETLYSVSSPELAAEILGDPDRFSTDEPGYRQIRQALGNGMLTSEGAVWRRQRRMLAPIFTPRRIARSYISIMVDEAQLLAGRWRSTAGERPTVDVNADMLELASRTIGRILYGSDMATALPQVMRFDYINEELLRRSVARHPIPIWVPTPANRKLKDGLRVLRQLVTDIIAARRAEGSEGATDDMLGLLLTARDLEEESGPLTDEEVIDQVLVFMLAGHDTTSTTLACSLVELARHPAWQQKVQEELQQELGDRPPSAHDATRLPWTGRVAREAMRLYPASHSTGRSPIGDQVVGGYLLPGGRRSSSPRTRCTVPSTPGTDLTNSTLGVTTLPTVSSRAGTSTRGWRSARVRTPVSG